MGAESQAAHAAATKFDRSGFQSTEESFGITELARSLYPAPNTAAQIATELGCSVRNIELCLSGKQNWSGDAVAVFVGEVLRRHKMRNFKVIPKR